MDSKIKYLVIVTIIVVVAATYLLLTNTNNQTITIVGSTSVQPVAQSLANAYMEKHPDVKITVQGGDSSRGIESAKSGAADIGTASDNLTSSQLGGLSEYRIGNDSIAIIVNPQNQVNSLTKEQLRYIYEGKITNWKQVGGIDAPITAINREVGSGTRLAFQQIVLDNSSITNNATVAISTYEALQNVAVDPNAIAFIARDSLSPEVKLLEINNVPLTSENVKNGKYQLQRPLLFLVKGTPTGVIKDFIDFCLSPEGQNIVNNMEYNSTPSSNSPNIGIGPGG